MTALSDGWDKSYNFPRRDSMGYEYDESHLEIDDVLDQYVEEMKVPVPLQFKKTSKQVSSPARPIGDSKKSGDDVPRLKLSDNGQIGSPNFSTTSEGDK